MGDTLKVVALSVGKVVHGIAVPLGSCAVVRNLDDAIDDRIAEVHVGICHVQFGTQHHRTFYGFGGVHVLKQSQILLNRTVTIRTWTSGLCGSALLFGYLL